MLALREFSDFHMVSKGNVEVENYSKEDQLCAATGTKQTFWMCCTANVLKSCA